MDNIVRGNGRDTPTMRCVIGDESVVFFGGGRGSFVTKVMPLSKGKWFGGMHPSEQVARLLLMRGMTTNPDISRIHHLRGILLEGVPALLIIQDLEEGREVGSEGIAGALMGLSRKTTELLDNVSGTNVISTRDGYKLIDALLRQDIGGQALPECGRSLRCDCDWREFVSRTKEGFGSIPKGYAIPEALKGRYAPESNPWIGEIERELAARRKNRQTR
ncbi:Uncharacterised protein [uncultured archaeon]|nr:Uncharacterised protein [uncultured archaeon]